VTIRQDVVPLYRKTRSSTAGQVPLNTQARLFKYDYGLFLKLRHFGESNATPEQAADLADHL